MENKTQELKNRTTSSTSSNSSVTEYVNELYEESELELSKVVSVQISDDSTTKNSLESTSSGMDNETKKSKKLQDFSQAPDSSTSSSQFVTKGFRKMYLAALIVLSFAACMGATATYSATAGPKLEKSSLNPTADQLSWVASLMPVGALMGGTAGGVFTNLLGRKTTLLFNSLPFVGGWLLIAYAKNIAMIYFGRLITGFCSGIVSVATPMYLVEIATLEVRGLFGASFQLFVVIGVFLISILGSTLEWGWLAISGAMLCLLSFLLMLPMPESPRWLVAKKRREEAKKAITFLQGASFDADAELETLESEANNQPKGVMISRLTVFLSVFAWMFIDSANSASSDEDYYNYQYSSDVKPSLKRILIQRVLDPNEFEDNLTKIREAGLKRARGSENIPPGFLGVRGKKTDKDAKVKEPFPGFLGVRGKKSGRAKNFIDSSSAVKNIMTPLARYFQKDYFNFKEKIHY